MSGPMNSACCEPCAPVPAFTVKFTLYGRVRVEVDTYNPKESEHAAIATALNELHGIVSGREGTRPTFAGIKRHPAKKAPSK
jgi:hypothetical protein